MEDCQCFLNLELQTESRRIEWHEVDSFSSQTQRNN
nr:MAG TPA: hypothetical protein [Bacteriophage sp.]